eukprot:gene2319-2671_t
MTKITKIEKLSGRNYQSWKYNIKLVLMERGLWGFTQQGKETPPATTESAAQQNAFSLRSDKAHSLIALNVEKDLLIHISATTDPYVAWERLQKQFEFVSMTQIVHLTPKFYAATMQEGDNLMKQLTQMTSYAEQLRELNEERNDDRNNVKNVQCFKCTHFGHIARNCRVKDYHTSSANVAEDGDDEVEDRKAGDERGGWH